MNISPKPKQLWSSKSAKTIPIYLSLWLKCSGPHLVCWGRVALPTVYRYRFKKMEILMHFFFIGWRSHLCLPPLRQCCWKLLWEFTPGLGDAFLKVWNNFPSGSGSTVSIKFETKKCAYRSQPQYGLMGWTMFVFFPLVSHKLDSEQPNPQKALIRQDLTEKKTEKIESRPNKLLWIAATVTNLIFQSKEQTEVEIKWPECNARKTFPITAVISNCSMPL